MCTLACRAVVHVYAGGTVYAMRLVGRVYRQVYSQDGYTARLRIAEKPEKCRSRAGQKTLFGKTRHFSAKLVTFRQTRQNSARTRSHRTELGHTGQNSATPDRTRPVRSGAASQVRNGQSGTARQVRNGGNSSKRQKQQKQQEVQKQQKRAEKSRKVKRGPQTGSPRLYRSEAEKGEKRHF